MEELADKDCVPCRGGVPPLEDDRVAELHEHVSDWDVIESHHLRRTYTFDDFATGLAFVNRVGAVAEEQAHHPDVHLAWGKVTVEIWTHAIDGLTERDFVLAAKVDRLS